MTPLTPDDFQAQTGVSRETLDRLRAYADLLVKWQARINLIGPATVGDLWRRHFLDSAQIFPRLPQAVDKSAGPLVDLGSGAGFPGLVLAILGAGPVHLLESDARKGAFLREAIRVTGAPATVHTARIEAVPPFEAAAVTARALAPLADLLRLAEPFVAAKTQIFFLKGRGVDEELTLASKEWRLTVERIRSLSDPDGVMLHISEVRRA